MEYWACLRGEYNVAVIEKTRKRVIRNSNSNSNDNENIIVRLRLNALELGRELLSNHKILEDISEGPVKLFVDANEEFDEIEAKIRTLYPINALKFSYFEGKHKNRVIVNIRCRDRAHLNEIRKQLGYEAADELITVPGSDSMKFISYSDESSFMIQDVSNCFEI